MRLGHRSGVEELGLEVRAGLHTGECELIDNGLEFDDRGTVSLKGIPGDWQLYAANP